MTSFPRLTACLVISFFLATLTACTTKKATPAQEELTQLNSIIVLPVETITAGDTDRTPQETEQLEKGRKVLDQLLADYFAGMEKITILTEGQRDTMANNFTRCRTTAAITICKTYQADAVLLCTLQKYAERNGTEYSVISPASVAFELKLVKADTGQSLCSGVFSETQKPLLDDMFKFLQKAKRGFKWITARALAREGLEQKLQSCPYLKK